MIIDAYFQHINPFSVILNKGTLSNVLHKKLKQNDEGIQLTQFKIYVKTSIIK